MREENARLIRSSEHKSKFSLKYHTLYLTIISVLSITLIFLTRSYLSERILNLYQSESIGVFPKNGNSQHKSKSAETNKFYDGSVKLAKPLKYILIWTGNIDKPMSYFNLGRVDFFKYGCEFNNCFLTVDRNLTDVQGDIVNYAAILFSIKDFASTNASIGSTNKPDNRDPRQVYILFENDVSDNYPICDNQWDYFFNWTWTYRLDSDLHWSYFTIRDKNSKNIAGPKMKPVWRMVYGDLMEKYLKVLKNKTKAVAWFVSDAIKESKPALDFVDELRKESKLLGFDVDVFNNWCTQENVSLCLEILKKDYKFYLSFEKSDSKDYVTERFAKAMINYAVPIVHSLHTNYTRFAPTDSFINARDHSPSSLAKLLKKALKDFEVYRKFHMWRNKYIYHYSYNHHSTHPLCKLCVALNDRRLLRPRVKTDLRKWWNQARDEEFCNT